MTKNYSPQFVNMALWESKSSYSPMYLKEVPLLLVALLDEIAFSSWKTAFLSSSLEIGTWSGFLAVSSV